jgi:anti-sigma regulatory factor (Ser/Thr protein kinase)
MPVLLDTTIVAQMPEASRIAETLGSLASADLGELIGVQIHLGVMESLSNIIRHGYGVEADATPCTSGWITIRSECGPEGWLIVIVDDGHPIPPHSLEAADGSVFDFDPECLDEVPTGGMGLTLVKTVFDRVDYRVCADGNRLVLGRRRALSDEVFRQQAPDAA